MTDAWAEAYADDALLKSQVEAMKKKSGLTDEEWEQKKKDHLAKKKTRKARISKEEVEALPFNSPVASDKPSHRYRVKVLNPKTQKPKLVYFGSSKSEDYSIHKDPVKRDRYLKRTEKNVRKDGTLTKDDPMSANYWNRRVSWQSGEDMSVGQ
jgi:hypothetical protein